MRSPHSAPSVQKSLFAPRPVGFPPRLLQKAPKRWAVCRLWPQTQMTELVKKGLLDFADGRGRPDRELDTVVVVRRPPRVRGRAQLVRHHEIGNPHICERVERAKAPKLVKELTVTPLHLARVHR